MIRSLFTHNTELRSRCLHHEEANRRMGGAQRNPSTKILNANSYKSTRNSTASGGAVRSGSCRIPTGVLAILCFVSIMCAAPSVCRASITSGLQAYRRRDYVRAFRAFAPLAIRGNARAEFYIGYMYLNGQGVAVNYDEAMKWLGRAAARGNSKAMFHLGFMYYAGIGTPCDYAEAEHLFSMAARRGEAIAEFVLGQMRYEGKNGPRDYAGAAAWFRKAAKGGIAAAMNNLGVMYQHGWGVEKNQVEAAKWFRKAAERGIAVSQYRIGLMYADGDGVGRDYVLAFMWLSLAAARGQKDAAAMCESLEAKMSDKEVARSKELAGKWRKSSGSRP